MNFLWYVVLGLVCYIVVINVIDFLVAKYKKPKDDYFAASKKSEGVAHDEDFKKKLS